jgi:hypothetical protein
MTPWILMTGMVEPKYFRWSFPIWFMLDDSKRILKDIKINKSQIINFDSLWYFPAFIPLEKFTLLANSMSNHSKFIQNFNKYCEWA